MTAAVQAGGQLEVPLSDADRTAPWVVLRDQLMTSPYRELRRQAGLLAVPQKCGGRDCSKAELVTALVRHHLASMQCGASEEPCLIRR